MSAPLAAAVGCLLAAVSGAAAQSARELNERAVALAQSGQYAGAVCILETAAALDPANAVLKHNLGVMRLELGIQKANQGDFFAAEAEFKQALPLVAAGPEAQKARRAYGSMLTNWAKDKLDHGDQKGGEALLKQALELDSQLGPAHWLLGNLYYQKSEYEDALYHLEWALDLVPEHEEMIADLIAKAETEMEVELDFTRKTQGNFTVSFEGNEQRELAALALVLLRRAQRDIGKALGYQVDAPIEVKIYTAAQFSEVLLMPDWIPGAFDGKIRLRAGDISVRDEEPLRKLIYHEYAHAAIFRHSRNRAPIWLHEGLAQCLQTSTRQAAIRLVGLPRELTRSLRETAVEHPLAYFAHLDAELQRRQDRAATRQAYQQAESLMSYLIRQQGYAGASRLLNELARGRSTPDALRVVYGAPVSELLNRWLRAVEDAEYRLTAQ